MAAPTLPPPAALLVDGVLDKARDGRTFATVNPATEEVVGEVPDGSPEDMADAIDAARRAFDRGEWANDVELRKHALTQLHAALVEHGPAYRALMTAEIGAPASLTTGPQYDDAVAAIPWVVDLLDRYEFEQDLGERLNYGMATARTVRREPFGVVGAITPWNFPTQINIAKVVPALAAGNSVVLKPAPDSAWIGAELGRLAAEHTDIPAGVFNVVTARDHGVGAMLSADPAVDLVSFTGSTATGRKVAAAGASTLKRVFLELGGKSAAIALDDADLATAVSMTAFTVCIHAGQGCALTTRLLVPRDRYDEAVDLAAATMSSVGFGDPTDTATFCGPLVSAAQRDRVEGLLASARDDGATFATGGGRPAPEGPFERGFWIRPTVVAGLDNTARIAREEVFGPVLVVLAHDGDDDAVAIANDSPYGLSGSVYSADRDRAMAVARRVRTGTMSVNGAQWHAPDVPFGGYKQSGVGRESGVLGFEEYLEVKSIAEPAREG